VLPFRLAGLDDLPAGETLYLHDVGTTWPYDTALGGPLSVLTLIGIAAAPLVAVGVVGWSAYALWTGRHETTRGEVLTLAAASAIALATLAWLATPLADDLIVWFFA
jgi:hypothetical protein